MKAMPSGRRKARDPSKAQGGDEAWQSTGSDYSLRGPRRIPFKEFKGSRLGSC